MPLVSSPMVTPEKLAANRANAQLLRGPITLEGLMRMRGNKIKQGAYAVDTEEALRALGEDRKDFDALQREDLSSRQVWRLTDLLLKLETEAAGLEQSGEHRK